MTKRDDDTLSRAEDAFQAFVDRFRAGNLADPEAFIQEQAAEVQGELRQMVEEFTSLRERLGQGSLDHREGRVIGDYRLESELGHGGMSVVWEAEQISLKRPVALKVLSPHQLLSSSALERFEREARAGGRLAHPGIVQTYQAGQADGVHYIAQELVPGGYTLADSFADLRDLRELPRGYFRGVAELFVKVADALHYAHTEGVIHRDVKPGNILITEQNEPRVTDFGLARIQDELSLSRTGEVSGTPYYMSPEQAAAKVMGLDHRTDVFSLGATLYEALTLKRAFDGDTSHQVFRHILTVEPDHPCRVRSRVPEELAVICLKALEKDRERRYATMQELADDLRRYLEGRPILARPPGPIARTIKWSRRHTAVSASLLVATGAFVIITALLFGNVAARRQAEESRMIAVESRVRAESTAEELRSAQLDILESQRELIRTAEDSGLTRKYENSFSDLSIDLARAYLKAGYVDEAADWLASAPIPAEQLRALAEDADFGPVLAEHSRVLAALEGRRDPIYTRHRHGLHEDGTPIETEVFRDAERIERLWVVAGKYYGVVHDADAARILGLRLGGEVDVLSEEAVRERSFLLFEGASTLRLARLGPRGGGVGSDVLAFGSSANRSVHAANSKSGSLWKFASPSAVMGVWPCDLDGDGIDETLAALNASAGLRVLAADGSVRLDIRGVKNPSTVTGADLDGDGQAEILSSSAFGTLRVYSAADGEQLASFSAGMYANWVRPRQTAAGLELLVLGKQGLAMKARLAVLGPDGEVRWGMELGEEIDVIVSMALDDSGRWLALSSRDFSTGGSLVLVIDLQEQREFAQIEYRVPDDVAAQTVELPLPKIELPAGLSMPKQNNASARQVAWMPRASSDRPPTLLVATMMGLRAYELQPSR